MNHDKTIINSYIQLAAAIVNSGIAAHDEVFLKSEWCQELTEAVVDFYNINNSSGIESKPAYNKNLRGLDYGNGV